MKILTAFMVVISFGLCGMFLKQLDLGFAGMMFGCGLLNLIDVRKS